MDRKRPSRNLNICEEESNPSYHTLIGGDYHLDYLILSHLPLLEIKNLYRNGEYFAPICADDYFWEMVANHHFPGVIPTVGTTWLQLVEFLTSDEVKNFNEALILSATAGNLSLVKYFISKGANNLDDGMYEAARAGHKNVVEYLITRGANDLNYGLYGATQGGHEDLIETFISRGANNLEGGRSRANTRAIFEYFRNGAINWELKMTEAARLQREGFREYLRHQN